MRKKKIMFILLLFGVISLLVFNAGAKDNTTKNRSDGASCHGVTGPTISTDVSDDTPSTTSTDGSGSVTVGEGGTFTFAITITGLGGDKGHVGWAFWHDSGDGIALPDKIDTVSAIWGENDEWATATLLFYDVLYQDLGLGTHIKSFRITVPSSPGTVYLYMRGVGCDSAGDKARSREYILTINIVASDSTPPAISSVQESSDPLELGNTETIQADVTDASTITSVEIEIGGTNYSMSNTGGDTYEYNSWTPTSVGSKSYTIYAIDENNNIGSSAGSILVQDTTNPSINSPSNVGYELGSTSNSITWTSSDLNPSTYELFIDGSGQGSTAWGGGNINKNVDSLSLGAHNITLKIFDVSGNWVQDEVTVTVSDTTNPLISSPSNAGYELGSTSNSITWTCSDLDPSTYELFIDESGQGSTAWGGGNINENIDSLSLGAHNITLTIFDVSGNWVQDEVTVTVSDTTDPSINSPSNTGYELGSTSNSIMWVCSDSNPSTYELFIDESGQGSTAWGGGNINENIDGLLIGSHNVTLKIFDGSGNWVQDEVTVTISDTTDPSVDHPSNTGYELGSTSNSITWVVSDLDPSTYELFIDESGQGSTAWGGGNINENIDGLSLGAHNITLKIFDVSGNWAQDEVTVSVSDTNNPSINSPSNLGYELGAGGNTITWTCSDLDPSSYEVFNNSNGQGSKVWGGGNIQINVNGLDVGAYNITLKIYDSSGNWVQDEVTVNVTDSTDPLINSPSNTGYELGSTSNSITWVCSDLDPSTYELFIDETGQGSTAWVGGNINENIDGLSLGAHNITLKIFDGSGNWVQDEVAVTISDTTDPSINNPSNTEYELDSSSNSITWICSDIDPSTYELYIDESGQGSTAWGGGNINENTDGLSLGVHNITLKIFDGSGNWVQDEVIVTVSDTTDPLINSPSNTGYELGSSSNSITWVCSDLNASTYELYIDESGQGSTAWVGGNINENIDSLSLGAHNVTLKIFDGSGNWVQDEVTVTISDTTNPSINNPSNMGYELGSSSNSITWVCSDLDPSTYELFIDESSQGSTAWVGGNINENIDGLSLGAHNITLKIFDVSGNWVQDEVVVIVSDTNNPSINSPSNLGYELGAGGNSITWTCSDLDPSSYEVFNNSNGQGSQVWGGGNIQINVNGLDVGTYNITLKIYDGSGNWNQDEVTVTVTDTTDPSINSPSNTGYEMGTTGNTVTWTSNDLDPSSYELFFDSTGQGSQIWVGGDIVGDIDGLSIGTGNVTLKIFDGSGNWVQDEVTITIVDTTDPTNNSIVIAQDPLTLGQTQTISINAYDTGGSGILEVLLEHGGVNYTMPLFIGNTYRNSSWEPTLAVTQNFKIHICDNAGNNITVTGSFEVIASSGPILTNLVILSDPSEYNDDVYIRINATDGDTVDKLWINFGGSNLSMSYISNDMYYYTYSVSSLGMKGFTIYANDSLSFENQIGSSVTVVDTTNPTISNPSNTGYELGSTSNSISWSSSDLLPSTYELFIDNIGQGSNVWGGGVVNESIDGLSVGNHNVTLKVFDTTGNWNQDEVTVMVSDTSAPSINNPSNAGYELGSTSNTITWACSDLDPSSYELFIETIGQGSQVWAGGSITPNIDGLALGIYNITLKIYDNSGNWAQDEVSVTVTDSTAPSVDNPSNTGYELGSGGNSITWSPSDLSPSTYELLIDSVSQGSNPWDGTNVFIDIDGLTVGTYNFTLKVNDTSANWAQDEVNVNVVDTTNPSINSPADEGYELGSTSNSITWICSDLDPDTYELFIDSTGQGSTSWAGGNIIENIDGLTVGIYNITLKIFDGSGNWVQNEVTTTVSDTTDPTINSPTNTGYELGSTSNTISWTSSDLDPNQYEVIIDGSPQGGQSWPGGNIVINIDGLSLGPHTIILKINDTTGNWVQDGVTVTVTDTTVPSINNPSNIGYELGSTTNSITWTCNDLDPSSYELFIDSVGQGSTSWLEGNINENIDGLAVGVYNITLKLFDGSGNWAQDEVTVTVTDTATPSIDNPSNTGYELGSTSNSITWICSDLDPSSYELFIDNVGQGSQIWVGGNIALNVDGLSLGSHNVTLKIIDDSNNWIQDEVTVTVTDTTVPSIDNPSNTGYELGSGGNSITWSPSDLSPSTYELFIDNVSQGSNPWGGSNVFIDIDGLSVGTYNFTLKVNDTSANLAQDEVIVTVVDTTYPTINSPADAGYELDSTSNSITWISNDLDPGTYELFINSVGQGSTSWAGGNINENIDGLSIGVYNITLKIFDGSGNWVQDEVTTTVSDTITPTINSPSDTGYELGSTINTISWTCGDLDPNQYEVTIDGSPQGGQPWPGGNIVIDIDGLSLGLHTIILKINDTTGNWAQDTIIVTITDTIAPSINSPSNIGYELSSTSNSITWTGSDLDPSNYELFIDNLGQGIQEWLGGNIALNVDGLSLGSHNVTLKIIDGTGNWIQDEVIVTVSDTNAPSINNPSNTGYELGSTANNVSWICSDLDPSSYELFFDSLGQGTQAWIGGNIVPNIDGLTLGSHNVTLKIFDGSNNWVQDELTVTITDTTAPSLNGTENVVYELGDTIIISATATDIDVVESVIIEISGVNHTMINVTGDLWEYSGQTPLFIGEYGCTIYAIDASGNSETITRAFQIIDSRPPEINDHTVTVNDMILDVSVDTSDASGIQSATMTINGTLIPLSLNDDNLWVYVATNPLEPGYYVWTINVMDNNGNSILENGAFNAESNSPEPNVTEFPYGMTITIGSTLAIGIMTSFIFIHRKPKVRTNLPDEYYLGGDFLN